MEGMIAHLEGTVTQKTEKWAVIDVAGIGYQVFVSPTTSEQLKEGGVQSLFTHLVVKEDALDLYGFLSYEEKDLFSMLISVSGVGPRSAIAILGLAPPATLRGAIAAGDTSYLTNVSGIGKKNAEKIILELKEKFGALESEYSGTTHEYKKEDTEVLEALIALGYSSQEAREALRHVSDDTSDTGDRVKEALKQLGGNS